MTTETRHILVVEDNIINQKVLTRQLQSRGFRVTTASDGQEALNIMQVPSFDGDLVLMDIVRPARSHFFFPISRFTSGDAYQGRKNSVSRT